MSKEQPEMARMTSHNSKMRGFIESIVDASGPYPELNGTQIVMDAYKALNPIQSELSSLRAENAELIKYLNRFLEWTGVSPDENPDSYASTKFEDALRGLQKYKVANAAMADILRDSLPVEHEEAPPVPQRLQDEASAEHLRSLTSAHPPRFFIEIPTGNSWEFRNGKITIDGDDSIFHSPEEILAALDIIETDEDGNQLEPSDADES